MVFVVEGTGEEMMHHESGTPYKLLEGISTGLQAYDRKRPASLTLLLHIGIHEMLM